MDDNGTSSRTAGVRFEVNDKQVKNEENGKRKETFLTEDSNTNFKNPDTSSLQVSAQSEDEEHKTTDSEYTMLDKTFDSAL